MKVTVERTGDEISVNFVGTQPEYEAWLRDEARRCDLQWLAAMPLKQETFWTEERTDRFVRRIKPKALKAIEVIARRAPEVSFDDVAKALGNVSGPELGGMMASVGFALKEMGAADNPPYERNYPRRAYQIDPDVAKALLAAIARFKPAKK